MNRFLHWTVAAALLALAAWFLTRFRPTPAAVDVPVTEPAPAAAADVAASEGTLASDRAPAADGASLVARMSPGCGGQDGGAPAALKWLARHQNEDGSWGGEVEMFEGRFWTKDGATALAMLALLEAGYTWLNKDPIDDRTMGAVVKAATNWLIRREPDNALDATLVALALSESYELTASARMREHSESAFERALGHQWADGSWGGDALTTMWGGLLLLSTRVGELVTIREAEERTHARCLSELGRDPAALAGLSLQAFDREDPRVAEACAQALHDLPEADRPEFTRWLTTTLAVYRADSVPMGGAGEAWKVWGLAVKDALIPSQERDGGWPGEGYATARAVRNALATLSLEVYYRYSGLFSAGAKSP